MSRNLLHILSAIVLLAFAVTPALAQSGKVTGTVVVASDGEPLPGVNVIVEGTTLGTMTDANGEYIIIGVRPGVYTVRASYVGFATARREGVQVSVDLTTTVDFSLREEILEGEEVVVFADAIAVKKDLTSSEARVTAETLDRLPVNELSQVLDVQAGVTMRGGLHIRGGRSSEVTYMVDGVPVTDRYDGSAAVQIENDGIQELQVISGTFNAEYGNAMSGVINVVSKEGGNEFAGSVKAYTGSYLVFGEGGEEALRGTGVDEFTVAGIQYRDVDPYSYLPFNATQFYNATVSLEGPIIGDRLTFFVLGRYFTNDGWIYGTRLVNFDGTASDSSLTSMNKYEKYSWQGTLRYRLSNSIILTGSSIGSIGSGDSGGGLYWRWNPEGISRFRDYGIDGRLKMTHFLSNTTFYTVDVATFYRSNYNRKFEDPFDPRYNDFTISPPDSFEVRPGEYQQILTGGVRFARGGTDLGRFERTTRSYLAKGDLSSQIGSHHLVKGGIQFRQDNLSLLGYGLIPAIDSTGARQEPFVPAIPDVNSSNVNRFDGVSPITVSAYLQDKVEYDDFVVNAGVRLDYFDARSEVPSDIEDPNIFNPLKKINRFHDTNGDGVITVDEEVAGNEKTIADREAYWYRDTEPKIQISPRLGVAYPISEQGVIHFSFGLFFQIPTLNHLFDNYGYKIPNLSGAYGPFGNPDLDAQKTTMYEIGFKQGFGDFVVDVTGYYRDVRDWISTSPIITTGQPGVNYVVYANRDYANTRGLTLSLSRSFENNFGFDAAYTFQVVDGSNSNPADEFFASQGNSQPTIALLPLNWDQRHKLAGAFYLGGNTWGASTRFRIESGFPYTPTFLEAATTGSNVQPEFPTNSRRIPATWEVDLSLYKEFPMGGTRPRIFVDVFNVFDRRNVASVYSDTGRPDVTAMQLQTTAFDAGYFMQPGHYREPRRIQAGIEFQF